MNINIFIFNIIVCILFVIYCLYYHNCYGTVNEWILLLTVLTYLNTLKISFQKKNKCYLEDIENIINKYKIYKK